MSLTTDPRVQAVLDKYVPASVQAFLETSGIRITVLPAGEKYAAHSEILRTLGVDVDLWPAPPAGLFVVGEKSLLLRHVSPMTIVHELGHALDCALGGHMYHSSYDHRLKALFSEARRFVTPYAATGIDEYFAEAFRAFCGANDPQSYWPKATKARLNTVQPSLYGYISGLFDQIEGGMLTTAVAV